MSLSLWLICATSASAATKFYDSTIGTTQASSSSFPPSPSGTAFGGFFSTSNSGIGDVAVNYSSFDDGNGTDGFIYVVDRGNNRVQAFDENGAFQFAIGRDVVAPNTNEAQLLTVDATAGQFRLCFNAICTVDLNWNAPATGTGSVQTALRDLTTLGGPAGTAVTVSGTAATATVPGRYAIAFNGAGYTNTNHDPITTQAGTTALTGSAQITTQADGSATPGAGDTSEIQTVTVGGAAAGGDFTLSFGSSGTTTTDPIHFAADAATVDTELEKLTAIGAGGVSVSGDPGGPYIVQFTGARASVDQAQMTANPGGLIPSGTVTVSTTQDGASFEKCTVAGQCKVGTTATVANSALGNAGTFNIVQGIDVNQETGDIFVNERATSTSGGGAGNRRVQQFTADGEFVRAFGWDVRLDTPVGTPAFETCNAADGDICQAATAAGTAAGQFGNATQSINGLAVAPPNAPNAGEVYVADPANLRILSFTVPSDPGEPVIEGAPIGSGGEFSIGSSNWPRDVAAGGDGIVYGSLTGGGGATNVDAEIPRFDTTIGDFLPALSRATSDDDYFDRGTITNLEVDHSTGNLLTARSPGSGGDGAAFEAGVLELDVSEKPEEFDKSHIVAVHAQGLGVYGTTSPNALGIGDGRFFLPTSTSSNGTGSGHRVLVLDDDGVDPDPNITIQPPDLVTATTATFRANIDPVLDTGFQTFYRWQIQRVGFDDEWIDFTSSLIVPPDGFTQSDVSHAASDLDSNTLYRIRIRTDRIPAAGVFFSPAQLFLTEPRAPDSQTRAAQHVSDVSAQVLGNLNPGGLPGTYWFEYGDAGLTETVPAIPAAADGGHYRLVGETLTGLSPATGYGFRLCAQNSLAADKVCGDTLEFNTRAAATSPAPGRAYEMVLSPDKPLRRGGNRGWPGSGLDYAALQTGRPSPDGASFLSSIFAGNTDGESGAGFTWDNTVEIRKRAPGGHWTGESVMNIAPLTVGTHAVSTPAGVSSDLSTTAWNAYMSPFSGGSYLGVRVLGDVGGPRNAGWYPWLDPSWFSGQTHDVTTWSATIGDNSERLVGYGDTGGGLRNVSPADGGEAPMDLSPAQSSGKALFLSGPEHDWRPADLVNECTGSVGASLVPADVPTSLPTRLGAGQSTDVIGVRDCAEGAPTSRRGATLGSVQGGDRLISTAVTSISQEGDRIFFASPDASTAAAPAFPFFGLGNGQTSCVSDDFGVPFVGAATECPAQIFVRAVDSEGRAVVRWISRAENDLFEAPQQIGLLGNGAAFEGASLDGQVVYFRSNAPLTTDDPNGGAQLPGGHTTGTASPVSWDLYRYELPPDPDADPADGELTRVSGGPDADADPNTNCTAGSANCGGIDNGGGSVARFVSDDGERVYFVTAAPIGSPADPHNAPPAGSSPENLVAGAATGNTTTRNLYLHDSSKNGSDAYSFVGRLPFSTANGGLEACATNYGRAFGFPRSVGSGAATGNLNAEPGGNCVRGSTSGDAIVFETAARLTADDLDEAFDLYLYDAVGHELVRLSAPPLGASPYICEADGGAGVAIPQSYCNGDLGFHTNGLNPQGGEPGLTGSRHWNIGEDSTGALASVFFQSRQPLAEGAAANGAMKVYEYRRSDGRMSLVSPAETDRSAFFSGNSLDGRDAFFFTEQPLSGWEIDPADGDIYNATSRTDLKGNPPSPPPACDVLANACQGLVPSVPTANGAASAALSGQGNFSGPSAKPKRRCNRNQVHRGNRCVAKRQLAKRVCAKRTGKAKRRCVAKRVRRLNRVQQRQIRAANNYRRASR